MRRALETVAFLGMAAVVHVAFFWTFSDEGVSAGGVGGDRSVSLLALSAQAETMVAKWEAQPEAITQTDALDRPDVDAPNLETTVLAHEFSADAQVQIAAVKPMEVPLEETALPVIDTASPPPPKEKPEPEPEPKPDPKKTSQKTDKQYAEKEVEATRSRAEERAAGKGGQKIAGKDGAKTENSISRGKREKLEKVWKSKVYRRLSRSKRSPKGRLPGGSVGLSFDLDLNGNVLAKRIVKSSGVPEYDKAAMKALERAGKFPAAPSVVTASRTTFNVSMKFER